MSDAYLPRLTARLRELGLPEEQVRETAADLAAHLAECGADPVREFGPVEEFARQLAPDAAGPVPPGAGAESWRWTADTSVDEELLGRFGDEGWEVERVDALGRFVCRRERERPQRWEYRRELVTRGREGLDERLAPDGWEPCGNWVVYAWFKRPRAASDGPAAELCGAPPAPPARRVFLSRRFRALCAGAAVAALAAGIAVSVRDGDPLSGLGLLTGLAAGALLPLGVAFALSRRT
ncbi:hypothetical protein [Streptomyces spectabilis]|uniref:DUF2812 domain-containing protein n=1 Tax=Streptomyces spectabilis TaxID=68270 RepID=A0A516R5B6_STRST|nr:hypothetical protein [Streptomyces spectabilis]QDQ10844.1 hypothetical protein FH965_09825 [Streptomyces spectabilis]